MRDLFLFFGGMAVCACMLFGFMLIAMMKIPIDEKRDMVCQEAHYKQMQLEQCADYQTKVVAR